MIAPSPASVLTDRSSSSLRPLSAEKVNAFILAIVNQGLLPSEIIKCRKEEHFAGLSEPVYTLKHDVIGLWRKGEGSRSLAAVT